MGPDVDAERRMLGRSVAMAQFITYHGFLVPSSCGFLLPGYDSVTDVGDGRLSVCVFLPLLVSSIFYSTSWYP